jgi:hypothetical protein
LIIGSVITAQFRRFLDFFFPVVGFCEMNITASRGDVEIFFASIEELEFFLNKVNEEFL